MEQQRRGSYHRLETGSPLTNLRALVSNFGLGGEGGILAQQLLWAGSPAARVTTAVSLSLRLTA